MEDSSFTAGVELEIVARRKLKTGDDIDFEIDNLGQKFDMIWASGPMTGSFSSPDHSFHDDAGTFKFTNAIMLASSGLIALVSLFNL